jgi:hypothetical protein
VADYQVDLSFFMRLSDEDVAVIYARACQAWYGNRASKIVTARIGELRRAGDAKDVRAWTQVAGKLSKAPK